MESDLLTMYNGVMGAILPMIMAVIVNKAWSKETKKLISLGLALAASVGYQWYSGEWIAGDVLTNFLIIASIATTTYKFIWQPSGMEEKVATSIGTGRVTATAGKK